MRLTLDASVLFPTVTRRLLVCAARAGAFDPIWSDRLIEEWRRAVARQFPDSVQGIGVEIALLQSQWPKAQRDYPANLEPYWLPDLDDRHVLALAVSSSCDGIVTSNAKDFPKGILAEYQLTRFDPDGLLVTLWEGAFKSVLQTEIRSICSDFPDKQPRAVLRKARLPKLGKRFQDVIPST